MLAERKSAAWAEHATDEKNILFLRCACIGQSTHAADIFVFSGERKTKERRLHRAEHAADVRAEPLLQEDIHAGDILEEWNVTYRKNWVDERKNTS